jgi:small basic protein
MFYAFLGIIIGLLGGAYLQFSIPLEYAHYTAVMILGLFDAIFGAIRADLVDNVFDPIVFLSGIIFNAILALCITYLGEVLGLNLYLAATVVFTFRIFQNVGVSRRKFLEKFIDDQEKKVLAKKAKLKD